MTSSASTTGPVTLGSEASPTSTSVTCITSQAATVYSAAIRSTLRRLSSE